MGLNADGTVTYMTPAGMRTTAVPTGTPQPQAKRGTYWRGADGNVWVAGSRGVNSAGAWNGSTEAYWNNQGYTLQADPNAPKQTGITDLVATGSGGGSSAPTYKDTTASRNATNVSLGSLDTVLKNALSGADTEYNAVKDAYALEDAENLTKYQGDVEKNEITRDESTQASLLGAARGSRGLYATLASLGALGGTGKMLANRAISTEANADLGAGEKSFETNVENLFDARSIVEKQEKQRKLDAEKTWKDTRQSAEHDYYKGKQDLSKEMASLWQEAGNFGEANNWTNTASAYTPEVAARTKVNPAQYAKTPLAYKAPELSKYLGGMNSTAVNVDGANPINGAIYTSTSKKDKELV